MADSLPTEGHVFWDTPELVSFMQAARACYIAGEDYDTLKDIIATVDELTPAEMRYQDPLDTWENVFGRAKPSKPASSP
jgi:hypothetical protein